jgi:hypothetical protein
MGETEGIFEDDPARAKRTPLKGNTKIIMNSTIFHKKMMSSII